MKNILSKILVTTLTLAAFNVMAKEKVSLSFENGKEKGEVVTSFVGQEIFYGLEYRKGYVGGVSTETTEKEKPNEPGKSRKNVKKVLNADSIKYGKTIKVLTEENNYGVSVNIIIKSTKLMEFEKYHINKDDYIEMPKVQRTKLNFTFLLTKEKPSMVIDGPDNTKVKVSLENP